ncbi:MAG: hypothetical protein K9I94_05590 [Bacteroidales bacterium]|nr:hypothetical protein [Bacteroidales bacterium]
MKKFRIIPAMAVLLATAFVLSTQSCKKDDDTQVPDNIVAESTKVIEKDNWQNKLEEVDTKDYTFRFSDNPGLREGDILVTEADGGYLRKVTNITVKDGKTVIETEFASISEAVERAHGKAENFQLIPEFENDSLWLGEGVNFANNKNNELISTELEIDLVLYDKDGNYQTTNDQVKLAGGFELQSDFSVEIDIKWFELQYLYVGYDFIESTNLSSSIGEGINYTTQNKIAVIPCGTIIIYAGIPIVIEPYIDFYAGCQVGTSVELEASVEQLYEYTASLTYDEGNWNSEKDINKQIDAQEPDLEGEVEAKVYIKPQLRFKVYQFVSPYANGEIFAKAETEMMPDIIQWDIAAGIGAHAGVKMQIFEKTLVDFEATLFELEWVILSGETGGSNTPPTASFTISPGSGNTSTMFNLDASACSDNQDMTSQMEVRWDFDGDGTWDTEFTTDKTEDYQYSTEGTYTVRLEVKDTGGLTDIATQNITVSDGGGGNGCDGITQVDYGGQVYNTVEIGDQCWLKENLNIGTMISGDKEMKYNGTIEKYCYDNDPEKCNEYGGLYQWDEMMQYTTQPGVQGICPNGWHIPTDNEGMLLEGTVDSEYGYPDPEWEKQGWRGSDAGYNLKSTTGWYDDGNGSDAFGFKALPGGYRLNDGYFYYIEEYTRFWMSTEKDNNQGWRRTIRSDFEGVTRLYNEKTNGFAIRCLKD